MTGTPATSSSWQHHRLHTINDMRQALGDLVGTLRDVGYSDKEQFGIRLTLEEAIVNSIKHGHQGDTSKRVDFRYRVAEDLFEAQIEDEGPGFNPEALPSPLDPDNIELPGGRGVFLMRHYMTLVQYNERGNCVMLQKSRAPGCNGTAEANGAACG